jgi:hypothetical protein
MTPAVLDAWTRYCAGETAHLTNPDASEDRKSGER